MRIFSDASNNQPPKWGKALLLWLGIALASIIFLWAAGHLKLEADRDLAEAEGRERVIQLTHSYA